MPRPETTLHAALTAAGFDWETGLVLLQPVKPFVEGCLGDVKRLPSDATDEGEVEPTIQVTPDHPALHDAHLGLPRFLASDGEFLYMPAQYEGDTWVFSVRCSPDMATLQEYIGLTTLLPYPGGG